MPFILAYKEGDGEWQDMPEPVYETGAEASAYAKRRNHSSKLWGHNTKFRVRTLKPDDPLAWRSRELACFADGTYTKVPWDHTNCFLEHVDPEDPTKVRFFSRDEDAWVNKYTRMSPGRFYIKYIDSSPEPGLIESYCAKMGLDTIVSKLQIGRTADEFEHVYTNGPHSCMAYEATQGRYQSGFHPVRVYGDLDLGVAYITRSGDITARTLVWPDKKLYGRIYGDRDRLIERLTEEGYIESPGWDFSGARLHLKRNGENEIISPYVDGDDLDGCIEDNYIVLGTNTSLILKGADGLVYTDRCQNCGETEVSLYWHDYHEMYHCGCLSTESED